MLNVITRSAFPLGALVIALFLAPAPPANAQAVYSLVADIPFAFHVGDRLMPAGRYRVQPLLTSAFEISADNRNGERAAFVTAPAGGGKIHDNSSLVFLRSGNQSYLSQIWRAGMANGYHLPKTKQQEAVFFRAASEPERIIIATLR